MIHQWNCRTANGVYGPFSTEQLRELTAARKIQPGDYIYPTTRTDSVLAYKFNGLFPSATFLEINFSGTHDNSSRGVTIGLNDRAVGMGQLGPGFCFWNEVQPGQHTVSVKLTMGGAKHYFVEIPRPGVYCCALSYGGFWGGFARPI